MTTTFTHKQIKEMCGTVSFKRGDSFYRAGKVSFDYYSPIRCEATVKGTEDFYVTINTEEGVTFGRHAAVQNLPLLKRNVSISLLYYWRFMNINSKEQPQSWRMGGKLIRPPNKN